MNDVSKLCNQCQFDFKVEISFFQNLVNKFSNFFLLLNSHKRHFFCHHATIFCDTVYSPDYVILKCAYIKLTHRSKISLQSDN